MKSKIPIAVAAFALTLCMLCTGCSTAKAVRVHPWDRGLLADSVMDPNRDPLGSAMMEHVTSSREAASGGRGVGGAGCGCN
jgi:hypothetical protein